MYVIKLEGIPVFQKKDKNSKVIHYLPPGTSVPIERDEDVWVYTDEIEGYIQKKYLSLEAYSIERGDEALNLYLKDDYLYHLEEKEDIYREHFHFAYNIVTYIGIDPKIEDPVKVVGEYRITGNSLYVTIGHTFMSFKFKKMLNNRPCYFMNYIW